MGKKDLPAPESKCMSCGQDCIFECFKCAKCKLYVHTKCSDMPDYYCVYYFTSRMEYKCRGCIQSDSSDYNMELAWVVDIAEREHKQLDTVQPKPSPTRTSDSEDFSQLDSEVGANETNIDPTRNKKRGSISELTARSTKPKRKAAQANSGNTVDAPGDGSASTQPGGSSSVAAPESGDTTSKTRICRFYRVNKCRFGKLGKNCPYLHPKLCDRYKNNGTNPKGGCKRGNECKFFHPKICHSSHKSRECFKHECNYLHLKGTKRFQDAKQETDTAAVESWRRAGPGVPRQSVTGAASNTNTLDGDVSQRQNESSTHIGADFLYKTLQTMSQKIDALQQMMLHGQQNQRVQFPLQSCQQPYHTQGRMASVNHN